MTDLRRLKMIQGCLRRWNIPKNYKSSADGDPVEFSTAHHILEIVAIAKEIEEKYIPALMASDNSEDAELALHEIREAIRHVNYHIKASEYLSIVIE